MLYFLFHLAILISIHAPRTGSDKAVGNDSRGVLISIHAPRTGSDCIAPGVSPRRGHFNPRSPHGERPSVPRTVFRTVAFQSTLPARGATYTAAVVRLTTWYFNPRSPHGERQGGNDNEVVSLHISIHAPRTGSDATIQRYTEYLGISIHAPRTGSDAEELRFAKNEKDISIHAPRTGSDADCQQPNAVSSSFQSTLPARGATKWKNMENVAC